MTYTLSAAQTLNTAVAGVLARMAGGVFATMVFAAINTTPNVRQALLKLGLTAKASNYERAYELKFGGMVKLANTSDLSSDASA